MSADIRQQLIALNMQVVEYYEDGRYRKAVVIATKACCKPQESSRQDCGVKYGIEHRFTASPETRVPPT
jgi:hypothetical protein